MFTFKRNNPTGRYRSFDRINTDIKIKGKQVGTINEGRGFNDWSVSFVIKDEGKECGWRWATLARRFDNEQEARDWLKKKYERLMEDLKIVSLD